jgi:two-component system OmpR family response regulator
MTETIKRTVLVVEDDIFISDILGRKLSTVFKVLHAANAIDAKKYLEAERVDLVCLDIGLPGENGIELLKEIRAGIHKEVPVVIVSNNAQDAEKEEALKAGANEYLVKSSVFLEEIVHKAEELLGLAS